MQKEKKSSKMDIGVSTWLDSLNLLLNFFHYVPVSDYYYWAQESWSEVPILVCHRRRQLDEIPPINPLLLFFREWTRPEFAAFYIQDVEKMGEAFVIVVVAVHKQLCNILPYLPSFANDQLLLQIACLNGN